MVTEDGRIDPDAVPMTIVISGSPVPGGPTPATLTRQIRQAMRGRQGATIVHDAGDWDAPLSVEFIVDGRTVAASGAAGVAGALGRALRARSMLGQSRDRAGTLSPVQR